MFDIISNGIDHICALEKNPIEELYEIKKFVMVNLKNEKSSPQYQLQKYYPKVYEKNPIGTGPFRFIEWKKGDRIVFERYEKYWKGVPKIKKLTFQIILPEFILLK